MNATQYAWYYLIKHGKANLKPSFYGGNEPVDYSLPYKINDHCKDYSDFILQKIREEGVDWHNTKAPKSETFSKFVGTFADPKLKEYLTGTLYFRDGTSVFFCAEQIAVKNIFDMMAMFDETKKQAMKLFGEDE